MLIFIVFATVALTLASVGLYGVVAHGVTERTHEIGVRMALGAESRHVLGLVVGQGLSMALIGTAIGVAGAIVLSRSVQGLLFGVTATDLSHVRCGRRHAPRGRTGRVLHPGVASDAPGSDHGAAIGVGTGGWAHSH